MESVDVAIIGSGFGGIGMAVSLEKAGRHSFVILEKEDRVGGTWRDNVYPGAACDVTSALYSFSFHPHVWTRKYPRQDEILEYIEEVVDAYGLRPSLRFGAEVARASFDERTGRWLLELVGGTTIDARVVVSSVGQLNRPAFPEIEGIGSFEGPAFHSARWDHGVSLAATRVGIIGTGASVIQFAPPVAAEARTTTIFQRSAPYVLPKPDPETPGWKRALFRSVPKAQLPARAKTFWMNEIFGASIMGNDRLRAQITKRWAGYMRSEIEDPELRAKCRPDYELGCKRVLLADDWYATLRRDDVELVTEPIARIVPDGVETADGERHVLDVLIYGTGFSSTGFLQPMEVLGRGGMRLEDRWAHGASAFRGVAVSGFPNLFFLYGPNTNLGANSIVYMLEAQIRYITALLEEAARARVGTVEVRRRAEEQFARLMEEKSGATAWLTGCHSWYTTEGRNTNNWPDATWRYAKLMRDVDLLDFDVRPIAAAVGR